MMKSLTQAFAVPDDTGSLLPCGLCKARAHGVCSAVAGPDLRRLAALARIVEVSRGQTFVHEDAPADHFYVLIVGSAKLYKLLPDGRRQIIGFEHANSFLGLSASGSYPFSAEALESIRMCRMPRAGLQAMFRDFPVMQRRLLELTVDELARAQEQMLLLGRKTAIERVASFLLSQATRARPQGAQKLRVHLRMSRRDVADYLGLADETVTRSLAKLTNLGVITIPNVHEVVILDPLRLEAVDQGDFDASRRISALKGVNAARCEPQYSNESFQKAI